MALVAFVLFILESCNADSPMALHQTSGEEAVTSFAANTKVSAARSQEEIRLVVKKYGAKSFGSFEDGDKAIVLFETQDRRVRFTLTLPDPEGDQFVYSRGKLRAPYQIVPLWEQACRQRWRALLLAIKAKLESVEAGIESFDEAFLSHIVLPTGEAFGPRALDAIAAAYDGKPLPPLLAGPQ